jgi:dihydroorotate dehydrogenase electron transfer subunit
MMRATARLCEAQHVPCWLSLETPMACGFGACFSCVTKVHVPDETGWDYRRTCIEGPVFPSRSLLLD